MLASLASQAATTGGLTNAIVAFAIAASTLVLVLTGSAIALSTVSDRRLYILATQGGYVKRVGGILLIAIGLWFVFLVLANPTYLLP